MYLQVEKQETGTKKVFRDKERTNKVSPIFLDLKVLTER